MNKLWSRPLWSILMSALVGVAVALALLLGGLVLFFPEEHGQETEPGSTIEMPVVIVPWSPNQ